MLLRTQDYSAFTEFQNSVQKDTETFDLSFNQLITLSDLILANNIPQATALAREAKKDNPLFNPLSLYLDSYKPKKPGLALFLSMICPGAGKWYTGSFAQGVTSFLEVGSFVSATVYTGIESNWKNWRPYVFGTCGAILYIVDIYGSYQAAKRYNATCYREMVELTEHLYEELLFGCCFL